MDTDQINCKNITMMGENKHKNEAQKITGAGNRPSWGESTHDDYQCQTTIQLGHTKQNKMGVTLFILLMAWTTTAKHACYRVPRLNQLFREVTTLGHLDQITEQLQQLKELNLITNSTWMGMTAIVEDMGHGWCKPRGAMKEKKKIKRNVLLAGLASLFTIGLLKIGPALASLFTIGSNPSPKYVEYMRNLGNITQIHGQLIDSLEKRVENLELKMKADSAIINILTLAMRESQIYRDLSKLNKRSNKLLHSIFEATVKYYKRLGLLATSRDTDAINGPFTLPHKTWSVSIKVRKNVMKECNRTEVFVEGIASLPSTECYYKIENKPFYTLIGRVDDDNTTSYRISGPEEEVSTTLQDGSIFLISNNYISPTKSLTGLDIIYREATLMIRPKNRAYALNTCEDHKWKFRLHRDRAYFVPLQCTSLIATSLGPDTTKLGWVNLAQQQTLFIDNNGKRLDLKEAIYKRGDGLLWRPFWAFENGKIAETKKKKIYTIEFPEFPQKNEDGWAAHISTIIATSVISMVASGGMAFCCWRRQNQRRREDTEMEHYPRKAKWWRRNNIRGNRHPSELDSDEEASDAEGSVIWVGQTPGEGERPGRKSESETGSHIYSNEIEMNNERITEELRKIVAGIEKATSNRTSTWEDNLGIIATTRFIGAGETDSTGQGDQARDKETRTTGSGFADMYGSHTSIKPVTWPRPVMSDCQTTTETMGPTEDRKEETSMETISVRPVTRPQEPKIVDQIEPMKVTNDQMEEVNRELKTIMKTDNDNDTTTHPPHEQDEALLCVMEQGGANKTWSPSRLTQGGLPRPKYKKFWKLLETDK
jgi:hypothetical protein